jgi:hypothetical protein
MGPNDDLILRKLPLQPFAQGPPKSGVKLLRHDLDYGNAVLVSGAAALPETLTRRPQKTRCAAKLSGEFLE